MFRQISIILVGAILIFTTLVACDQLRVSEYEADRLDRGNEVLAACISSQCEVLNLDGLRLKDYSVINALTHVTVLMASRTDFDDLNDIKDMTQLRELHITYAKISDLTGLVYFPNLTLLHAERMLTNIDFSPVAQLTSLTELALGNLSESDDASFIQNLKKLETLKISWESRVADISFLRQLPSLRTLNIGGGLPADQSTLLMIPRLESFLILSGNGTLNPDVSEELERRGVLDYLYIAVC